MLFKALLFDAALDITNFEANKLLAHQKTSERHDSPPAYSSIRDAGVRVSRAFIRSTDGMSRSYSTQSPGRSMGFRRLELFIRRTPMRSESFILLVNSDCSVEMIVDS